METKTITIRVPLNVADTLSKYENVTAGVVTCVERFEYVLAASKAELKGKFSEDEWHFFADSLNGTGVDGAFRVSVSALVAHCQDSELYEGTATKWGIDLNKLIDKIKILTGAQVEALYSRVEAFWNGERENFEEW